MKKSFLTGLLLLTAFFQFGILVPAHADQSLLSQQEGFKANEIQSAFGATEPKDLRTTVANVIFVALSLLGVIFLVLLVLAGYKYMMASGNEDQVKTAIKQITQAVIGLVIILSAWGITLFVLRQLTEAAGNSPMIP